MYSPSIICSILKRSGVDISLIISIRPTQPTREVEIKKNPDKGMCIFLHGVRDSYTSLQSLRKNSYMGEEG